MQYKLYNYICYCNISAYNCHSTKLQINQLITKQQTGQFHCLQISPKYMAMAATEVALRTTTDYTGLSS